jgi:hypothetical protein
VLLLRSPRHDAQLSRTGAFRSSSTLSSPPYRPRSGASETGNLPSQSKKRTWSAGRLGRLHRCASPGAQGPPIELRSVAPTLCRIEASGRSAVHLIAGSTHYAVTCIRAAQISVIFVGSFRGRSPRRASISARWPAASILPYDASHMRQRMCDSSRLDDTRQIGASEEVAYP